MKHYIIAKYNEKVADRDRFAREAEKLFSRALETEGVRGVRVKRGLPLAPNRYDLMIIIDMDEKSLPLYNESDYHAEWKRDYGEYLSSKAIFDEDD